MEGMGRNWACFSEGEKGIQEEQKLPQIWKSCISAAIYGKEVFAVSNVKND